LNKRGIGKTIIQATEKYLLEVALSSTKIMKVTIQMGVINLRKDLFSWYEKQGYSVVGEIRPNDEELSRIILDDLDVCCVLMTKSLI
jgi:hypothetical protein